MLRDLRTATRMFLLLSVLTGVLYPGLVTVTARLAFPGQSTGSIVRVDGKAVGSRFIGQAFSAPRYFWGRPSATGPMPGNGAASSGSNVGPSNPALVAAAAARIATLRAADPGNTHPVPVDLVTASASGLDPEISIAAAEFQVPRVARARGLAEDRVRQLMREATYDRTFGVLGEPRVNVLELNLALDRGR
ncbi:MAG TPA: potassium-transporting ATPase subunit KdpC [Steroidobacteraceae bacterium]